MKLLEIEWTDGGTSRWQLEEGIERDALMRWLNRQERDGMEVLSAWIDQEPWFGLCTAEHLP